MTDRATAELALREELQSALSDWDGDFDVTLDPDEWHRGCRYFDVTVKHQRLGGPHHFRMRVGANLECEINTYEDSYHPLTMGSLFAYMWFDAVTHPLRGDTGNG